MIQLSVGVLLAMLNFFDASDKVLHSPLKCKIILKGIIYVIKLSTSSLQLLQSHKGFVFESSRCSLFREESEGC